MKKRLIAALSLGIGQASMLGAAAENGINGGTVELPEVVVEGQVWQDPELVGLDSDSATKMNVPLIETPRSISIVTRQMMEDMGVGSVEEALLYVPGVYGATFGVDTRGDWSMVRGVAPQEFRDGLKSLFGFYNNVRPHPYTFDRVEIVKGPASVLYGQGTLGGIVNVVTKRPLPVFGAQVEAKYGSHDHMQIATDINGPITSDRRLLYRVVGVLKDSGTQVDHVDADEWVISPAITWAPTDSTALTVLGNFQEFDGGLTTQFLPLEGTLLPGRHIPTDTFVGEPEYDRYETEQSAITLILEQDLAENWRVEAKGRYTDSFADYNQHWPTYNGPDGGPVIQPDGTVVRTIYDSDHAAEAWVGDVRVIADLELGDIQHKAAAGIDYQDAETDNDVYYGFAQGGEINIYDPQYGNIGTVEDPTDTPATETEQIGVYLNNHTTVNDSWIFSYGVRNDWVDPIDEEAVSLDFGALYKFENGLAPYVSYADSFEPIAGSTVDDQPFQPKEGKQYEAGVKYQPAGGRLLYTASIFQITEENRPMTAPGGAGQVQTGEVEIQGLELSAQHRWNDFYGQLAYTYLDTEIVEGEPYQVGTSLPSVPDTQASAWLTYAPEEGTLSGFRVGFGVRYVGETSFVAFTGREFITPDYWLYDAMVGYTWENFRVSLNVQNLLDETYVTSAANASAFYGQRRDVTLSASYNF